MVSILMNNSLGKKSKGRKHVMRLRGRGAGTLAGREAGGGGQGGSE